jgi:pimeloyl-ACP methyl ester carboxylesterase
MAMACVARAQDIAGDWQGTLHAGPTDLRIVLHIVSGGSGALKATTFKATMDSIDQGGFGIPVTSVSLANPTLNLAIDALHATYQGKLNADATGIEGIFTQGQPIPLNFARLTPSDIDGAWQGTLDLGAMKMRVIFHLADTARGLTAAMATPDQSPVQKSATSAQRDGAAVAIEWTQIGARFEGKIAPDQSAINGTYTQGGSSYPLSLRALKSPAGQEPAKPYPYKSEDVAYRNNSAGIELAGTLTVPQGKGPFPAVVLIPGSGPQDRDETMFGHRPFLVLADYLTRQAIAVLRADDRGVGKSGGNLAAATSLDLASDAEAGIAFLKTRAEVDAHRIGLIGHSEGGLIAPMIAARNPDVSFVVMMAGQGVSGEMILLEQARLIGQAGGASAEQLDRQSAMQRVLFQLIKENKDNAVLAANAKEQLAAFLPEETIVEQIAVWGSPWSRFFREYNPVGALRKVRCPVLALIGEKDLKVPPKQNLPPIRAALGQAGNEDFEVDEMPGLNHLFQTANTGSPSEYGVIEETISPVALENISGWILKRFGQTTRP